MQQGEADADGIPDSIGHGKSSKPSDGLHARFPHYDYYYMVEAQFRLVSEGLGVNHLRLVTGISQGGMHTWLWGELHPDFMDALMPMVSQPVEIAGRNHPAPPTSHCEPIAARTKQSRFRDLSIIAAHLSLMRRCCGAS